MNIIFSSDDNYVPHLGVAIYSVLSNNKDAESIHLFVIDNHINEASRKRLLSILDSFSNVELTFIPFDLYQPFLHLNLKHDISLSSYARLFIAEMLPLSVNRIIYMDCDVCILGALSELWNWDLKGMCIGAVQDTIPSVTKSAVGLLPTLPYFNAGLLLIDLAQWRKNKIGEKCLQFIDAYNGCVIHHDQGVLNGVFNGQWERLPIKYNMMTLHYLLPRPKVKKFYGDEADFYDDLEVADAIEKPVILHFTPSFTSRPWEKNCSHPLRNIYLDFQNRTPWAGTKLLNDSNPWYVRLINLWYRYLPF